MSVHEEARRRAEAVRQGGAPRYHEQARQRGKLFCRDRIALLCDQGSFVEDGLLANAAAGDLPADGVVTGLGQVGGRPVAVMANDSTVKAGSWGARTVEKILRIQESAARLKVPLVYLVDSAGARITDQVAMFPGRRHAGHIFFNQTRLSGLVPQVCVLLGPSAAGGAYIPAFCDIVIMVEGNASMYLGSPRMAEMVIGEKVSLEEMGGARMHCTVSGCGDLLAKDEREAIGLCRSYLGYLPGSCAELPPVAEPKAPSPARSVEQIVPDNQNAPFDMNELLGALFDDVFPLKPLYAGEVITAFARLDGRPVGVVANQPKVKGGVLFVDSADKAARFIWLCDAFHLPLVFLADVPGFMIGTAVERAGIIRHGAKMIAAVSEATVPKICVVVRKAYGAGLYAMSGPGFEPDCTLALPTASIAVMGPEAAVNAVYANKIAELPAGERGQFVQDRRTEYAADIDIYRLASELVVEAVVPGDDLREELVRRLDLYAGREAACAAKKHAVHPV